ncbi:hypothetical protein [Methylobacterium sp. CM6247]
MTPENFIKDFRLVLAGHSKRSPKLDELKILQSAGFKLMELTDDRSDTQSSVLEAMCQICLNLHDHEALVSLFERALAKDIKFRPLHFNLLAKACEDVMKAKGGDPSLKERLNNVRYAILHSGRKLSPTMIFRLSSAGEPADKITEQLQNIPNAERTSAQQVLLAETLIEKCDSGKGDAEAFVQALTFVDENLESLELEGERHRLLTWLAILLSAKYLFLAINGQPDGEIGIVLRKLRNLDDSLRQPLAVVRQSMQQLAMKSEQAKFRYLRSVINIEAVWRYEYAEGREFRAFVFNEVLDALSAGQTYGINPNSIALRLFRCMGQCEDFWVSESYRKETLTRYFNVIDKIEEPRRSVIKGICHLALDEQHEAEILFAQRRGSEYDTIFNGSGHVTFIPSKKADEYLDGPSADLRYSAEASSFRFVKPLSYEPSTLTVVACADPRYLKKYYSSYTESLFQKDRSARAHFHLLGDVESVDEDLMGLIMANDRVSLSTEDPPVKAPYYYATARFLRVPLFMQAAGGDVLLTDMDIKFSESPSEIRLRWQLTGTIGLRLYDKIRSFRSQQFITLRPPRMETWGTLNASCLYFGRGDDATAFAESLSQISHLFLASFQDSANSNWWIDQNIIFATLRVSKIRAPSLRIFNLLDVGIPFGMFRLNEKSSLPAYGHHPAMPRI